MIDAKYILGIIAGNQEIRENIDDHIVPWLKRLVGAGCRDFRKRDRLRGVKEGTVTSKPEILHGFRLKITIFSKCIGMDGHRMVIVKADVMQKFPMGRHILLKAVRLDAW